MKVNNIKFTDMKDEDKNLIKSAMLQCSLALKSEALNKENEITKSLSERNIAKSERLIYLVNFLNGVFEYDR